MMYLDAVHSERGEADECHEEKTLGIVMKLVGRED